MSNINGMEFHTDKSEYEYYGNPKTIRKTDYDRLNQIDYNALGITIDRVKLELLGLRDDLTDPTTGKEYPDAFYTEMINKAVAKTEKEFDIVVRPRIRHERLDFNQTEFNSYVALRTYERPIIQVDELKFIFNNQSTYDFPDEWLKVTARYGQIEVQPNFMMGFDSSYNMLGLSMFEAPSEQDLLDPNSYGSTQFAPQMVGCTYIAGMLPQKANEVGINSDIFIQPDLVAYIAKDAAIEVLERWGRLILGAGISGYSATIDGISTSVDSTQSAENTGSSADIKLIQEDMKDMRSALQSYYGYNLGFLS